MDQQERPVRQLENATRRFISAGLIGLQLSCHSWQLYSPPDLGPVLDRQLTLELLALQEPSQVRVMLIGGGSVVMRQPSIVLDSFVMSTLWLDESDSIEHVDTLVVSANQIRRMENLDVPGEFNSIVSNVDSTTDIRHAITVLRPGTVRLLLRDGSNVVISTPAVVGDSILGYQVDGRSALRPIGRRLIDVQDFEIRSFDAAGTIATVLGVALLGVAVGAIALSDLQLIDTSCFAGC